jgi:hypothetical protein
MSLVPEMTSSIRLNGTSACLAICLFHPVAFFVDPAEGCRAALHELRPFAFHRLHDDIVPAGDRVAAERHAGEDRLDDLLHDDSHRQFVGRDIVPFEVGFHRRCLRRRPDRPDRLQDAVHALHVQHGFELPGKRTVHAVFDVGGGADGVGFVRIDGFCDFGFQFIDQAVIVLHVTLIRLPFDGKCLRRSHADAGKFPQVDRLVSHRGGRFSSGNVNDESHSSPSI